MKNICFYKCRKLNLRTFDPLKLIRSFWPTISSVSVGLRKSILSDEVFWSFFNSSFRWSLWRCDALLRGSQSAVFVAGWLPALLCFLPWSFSGSARGSGSRPSLTCCEIRRWRAARWVTAQGDADERRRKPDIYLAADGNRFLHEWVGRRRSCRLGRLARKQRSHLLLLLRCLSTLHASFVFPPHSHTRLFLSAAQPSGLWLCQRLQLLRERPFFFFFIQHSAESECWAELCCSADLVFRLAD